MSSHDEKRILLTTGFVGLIDSKVQSSLKFIMFVLKTSKNNKMDILLFSLEKNKRFKFYRAENRNQWIIPWIHAIGKLFLQIIGDATSKVMKQQNDTEPLRTSSRCVIYFFIGEETKMWLWKWLCRIFSKMFLVLLNHISLLRSANVNESKEKR